MSSAGNAAAHRWLPATLSIVSALWLLIAAALFIAADGEPHLLFVAPIAAAPGIAQFVTGAPVRALYSAAFLSVLAAFVFAAVTFIIFASFAVTLALPTVCLGIAWRLTRHQTPPIPHDPTQRSSA